MWLAGEIMPLIRDVSQRGAGAGRRNPSPVVRALAGDFIEVAGRVSEDELRARYARARIAMVPLRIGAGVKSKVVEALREGLPLVTTSVGAQGLPGLAQVVSIADDPRGLADAAVKLILDDAAWKKASARQIQYARKHFSRDAFRRSFFEAIGDRNPSPRSTRR